MKGGLSEELADAPVFVYPDDGFSQQRCDRQHLERRPQVLWRNGDGVGDDHLVYVSFLQSRDGVAREHGMSGRDENLVRALRPQRGCELSDGVARRDYVLDHHAVATLHIT